MADRYHDPIPELKKRVSDELVKLIDNWTQWNAAVLLHVSQTQISEIRAGKLERFSLDRLVRLLARAGRKIEIRTTSARASAVFRHELVDGRVSTLRARAHVPDE
jgi:predicted XRE-type DNA-binding protein